MKNDCTAVRQGRQKNMGMPMKGFQNVFPNMLSTWKEDIADNQVELWVSGASVGREWAIFFFLISIFSLICLGLYFISLYFFLLCFVLVPGLLVRANLYSCFFARFLPRKREEIRLPANLQSPRFS